MVGLIKSEQPSVSCELLAHGDYRETDREIAGFG
jgi:hypothetical protein